MHVIEVVLKRFIFLTGLRLGSFASTRRSFDVGYVDMSLLLIIQRPKGIVNILSTISVDFRHALKWTGRFVRTTYRCNKLSLPFDTLFRNVWLTGLSIHFSDVRFPILWVSSTFSGQFFFSSVINVSLFRRCGQLKWIHRRGVICLVN